ncbi:hypothetical protein BGZ65_003457 [Modicella reniformis]|uniref:Uncharacterized protein n=1 Tax=Modicella reniformis TaxID=1440133 RepID=A0A9P6MHI1_9FUNG|nr:hypothetical protein BGZ65_003457 [Modicella reniformis]
MAETYYWGRQDRVGEKHKTEANAFWKDFVDWEESKGSFLSQNFVVNTKSFTNAMATIALLDVVFKPNEMYIKRSADRNLVVSSLSPAIIFHSSTKELNGSPVTGSVLVTQQYFEKLDRTEYDSKLMTNVCKYIQNGMEFRPLTSYGAHVVLMNATPNPMKLHVEVQLPQGAISIGEPLESGQDIQLAAHGNFQYEYCFYFPEKGDFPHYPAHVSDYEDVIAFASPTVLKVRVAEPGQIGGNVVKTSWNYVLARGSKDDVLKKLATNPLEGLKVELLIPRLYKDHEFLKSVTDVLRDRHEYNDRIWSLSLALEDEATNQSEWKLRLTNEYISNKTIAQKVGDWFTSPLLTRRPRSRYESWQGAFHYLEYFPLINARVHKANKNAAILNDRFKDQYEKFLHFLCQKPGLDADDLLVLVIYLVAQDRIVEAKSFFSKLADLISNNSHHLENTAEGQQADFQQIQYDYLRAYLSLCVEIQEDISSEDLTLDLDGIQNVVNKYQDYPVQRWNQLFKDMKTYVDEIIRASAKEILSNLAQGDTSVMDTEKEEEGDSNKKNKYIPVAVDFKIGSDNHITIHHRGVDQVTIEYYAIDAETMFSASPLTFSDQGESEINTAATTKQTVTTVASGLPWWNKPAVSSVSAADTTSYRYVKPNGVDQHSVERAVADDASTLRVPILERYRTIKVVAKAATPATAGDEGNGVSNHKGQSIRGAYVKVYAELKNGNKDTAFWKDGYTDLVGRFDYVTVSMAGSLGSSTLTNYNNHNSNTNDTSGGGNLTDVKRFVVFVDGGKEGCAVKTVPVPSA